MSARQAHPIRAGDVQAERASNARPGQGPRGQYSARSNTFVVTPEAVASAGFTWERVAAFQCVSTEQYTVPEIANERDFFTKHGATALMSIYADGHAPKPLLMQKFAEAVGPLRNSEEDLQEVFHLRSIKYGQLLKCNSVPDTTSRAPPADDPTYQPEELYESFDVITIERGRGASADKEVIKKFVQAPMAEGGWYAELASSRNIMYKVSLEFDVRLEGFNQDEDGDGPYEPPLTYGLRFEYGQRTKACLYTTEGMGERDSVIKLTLGHFDQQTDRLVAWKCVHGDKTADFVALKSDALARMLFDQQKWPKPQPQVEYEDYAGAAVLVGGEGPGSSRGRWSFREVDDRLCHVTIDKSSGSKEPESIELANFCIPKVLALYQFVEAGEMPMFKLLCRVRLAPATRIGVLRDRDAPPADTVLTIFAEQEERAPSLDGVTLLEIEAIICVATLDF